MKTVADKTNTHDAAPAAPRIGYGIGPDGVSHTHDERRCDQCGEMGYLTYLPGEGETDDEHGVLVTPGRIDGSELDLNFCENCAEETGESR